MPSEPICVNLLRSPKIDSERDGMVSSKTIPESVFVNVYGAQESILPGWETIPGLLKRFTHMGSRVVEETPKRRQKWKIFSTGESKSTICYSTITKNFDNITSINIVSQFASLT